MTQETEIDRITIQNQEGDTCALVLIRQGIRIKTTLIINGLPFKPQSFQSAGPAMQFWAMMKERIKASSDNEKIDT